MTETQLGRVMLVPLVNTEVDQAHRRGRADEGRYHLAASLCPSQEGSGIGMAKLIARAHRVTLRDMLVAMELWS